MIVANGSGYRCAYPMTISDRLAVNILTRETRPLMDFQGTTVHVIAGIGYPQGFFDDLRAVGLDIKPHPYADHYRYKAGDVTFDDSLPVLMTEKDAVKCRRFAKQNLWYVRAGITMNAAFSRRLLLLLGKAKDKRQNDSTR